MISNLIRIVFFYKFSNLIFYLLIVQLFFFFSMTLGVRVNLHAHRLISKGHVIFKGGPGQGQDG